MFSGIVQACIEAAEVEHLPGLKRLSVILNGSLASGIRKGASIALDGVCLTVAGVEKNRVLFEIMDETLQRTTLGRLEKGSRLNVERSVKVGDEVGGHSVSGHVDAVVDIVDAREFENNKVLTFRCDPKWMRYIFSKGFIALDGASLTIVDVDKEACTFTVHFIPETLRVTTFGFKGPGDRVNMEIERQTQAIVDTVERIMKEKRLDYEK